MNTLPTNSVPQPAQQWSAQLGQLAAEHSGTTIPSLGDPIGTTAPPSRLAAILQHFRHQQEQRDDMADKLRAQEFIMEA